MTALRRHSALVAALVLVMVAVQMLDMGLCCELERSEPAQAEATVLLISKAGTSGRSLVSISEDGRHRHLAAQPDCICHMVFVSTGTAPALQATTIPISTVTEAQASPHSIPLPPPGHIPLSVI